MSLTVSTKMDTSGFKALKAQLESMKIDVGWIDTPNHWMASALGRTFSVAQVASHLHYYSPWEDMFALSETKTSVVNKIVHQVLNTSFGKVPLHTTATLIGLNLQKVIEVNIKETSYPENSDEWKAIKTFNDPLVFGSRIGETPNLISELKHRVRK